MVPYPFKAYSILGILGDRIVSSTMGDDSILVCRQIPLLSLPLWVGCQRNALDPILPGQL